MKKKILFIINPISGVGRQKLVEKLIDQKLNKSIYDYEVTYTKAAKHAIELSTRGTNENFETIVAVGGDGSVNEVGRSLIGKNTSLAILPCGSGNGAARHLNIPMNLVKAMDIINGGRSAMIDTFYVNDEIAINTAGVGFAAHIAHEFSRFKKRGFGNYLKIAVRDSMKYKSQPCHITLNGKVQKLNAFIIDIANGTQWGNNAVIAPHADNTDGVLDLCVIRNFPLINFPLMAARLFTQSIHRSRFVEITKMKEVMIRQEKTYAHIDGEPVTIGNELRVKINPLSLKVLVP